MHTNRTIKPELEGLQDLKETLCNQRLIEAKQVKTPDWTNEELDIVLNHLKKDKSRDPHGFAN